MGFVMLGTMVSFMEDANGFIPHFSRKASGATISFVLIFSFIIIGIAICGFASTIHKKANLLHCTYGACLFFFGFIPLVAVAGSLLELSTITESDLVAMCYSEIHDSQMLKEVAAPTGASDVFANIGEVKN